MNTDTVNIMNIIMFWKKILQNLYNPGAGKLKNPKNGSGSYFYLIAIFGCLIVPPISPQRDTYQKVHRGPVIGGVKFTFTQ